MTGPLHPAPLPEVLELLDKLYNKADFVSERGISKTAFAFIEQHFAEGRLDVVDNLLASLDFTTVSVWVISGVLRCTARARQQLPSWHIAFSRGRQALIAKGENVDSLLIGLASQQSDKESDAPPGPLPEVAFLFERLYNEPEFGADHARSKIVLDFITQCYRESSLYALDSLLEFIDFSKLTSHTTYDVMSTTLCMRRILPSWDVALLRAIRCVEDAGTKNRLIELESMSDD